MCSTTNTPLSSLQFVRSRLIRPCPAASLQINPSSSSSQYIMDRSGEAANTHFVANLAAEGEELTELGDEGNSGAPISSFQERDFPSCGVAGATPAIFHPFESFLQHTNAACNQFATENLVLELAEKREEAAESIIASSSSTFQRIKQCFIPPPPATQPSPVSLCQSNSCSLEHVRSHFAFHEETKAGHRNVVQNFAVEREEETVDEINSSTPLPSFQLIQSRLIRRLPHTSVPTINNSQHQFSPLSVYEDCLRQMLSGRPNARGDMCRRRLFNKSINLDEADTSPGPRVEKRARVDDYLDDVLLSEAALKMRFSCLKQEGPQINNLRRLKSNLSRGCISFDWPSADLHAMTTSTPIDCYPLIAEKQFLINDKDDDSQFKQYQPNVRSKSRRVLHGQDTQNQADAYLTNDMSSQFSSCAWPLSRGYDHGHDCSYHSHHSTSACNSSMLQHDSDIKGFTLSPSTPPDNF